MRWWIALTEVTVNSTSSVGLNSVSPRFSVRSKGRLGWSSDTIIPSVSFMFKIAPCHKKETYYSYSNYPSMPGCHLFSIFINTVNPPSYLFSFLLCMFKRGRDLWLDVGGSLVLGNYVV